MTIDFYYMPGSAPCRTVLLTAAAAGVELNLKVLDLMKGEHLAEEFVKINPQHTVPTLVDNGFVLHESRAIATYLVEQYAKDDTLYPKDIKERAMVDQRLYFDMGTLYQRLSDYYYPVFFSGGTYDPEKYKKIETAFEYLDIFLKGKNFLVGTHLTVADLSIIATVSTYEAFKFDISKYPNVVRWYETVKDAAPDYEEANVKNLAQFVQFVDEISNKK